MKVISVQQPFATLLVQGHKIIETRSWKTKHRGPILIHASESKKHFHLAATDPFIQYNCKDDFAIEESINNGNYTITSKPVLKVNIDAFAFGAIIGMVTLIDILATEDIQLLADTNTKMPVCGKQLPLNWQHEIAFGDYSNGRYGWLMAEPILFPNPIKAKGKLSVWDYDIQDLEITKKLFWKRYN